MAPELQNIVPDTSLSGKMCLLRRDRDLFRCSDTAAPNSPRNRSRSRRSEFFICW